MYLDLDNYKKLITITLSSLKLPCLKKTQAFQCVTCNKNEHHLQIQYKLHTLDEIVPCSNGDGKPQFLALKTVPK